MTEPGNEIRYHYKSTDESVQLDYIEYTALSGDPAPGPFKVHFAYSPRSYSLKTYVAKENHAPAGRPYRHQRRGPGRTGMELYVHADPEPGEQPVALSSVTLCSHGTCTQPRLFEYEDATPQWSLYTQIKTDYLADPSSIQVLDFNGDGRDDIVFSQGKATYAWLNKVAGNSDGEVLTPEFKKVELFGATNPIAVDVDRDGAVEIAAFDHDSDRWRLYGWYAGRTVLPPRHDLSTCQRIKHGQS